MLISLLVLATLTSCASMRRATPIAVEDLKTYPVEGQQESQQSQHQEAVASHAPAKKEKKQEEKKKRPLSQQVIDYARTFTGVPYRLGARGPEAFDCSNFTSYVFKHFGYNITPYSVAQYSEGREVASYSDLQRGDLVFFGKRGSVRNIGHVGIVVSVNQENGSFNFIHASVSKGVTEDNSNHPYYLMRYIGARRILPDE